MDAVVGLPSRPPSSSRENRLLLPRFCSYSFRSLFHVVFLSSSTSSSPSLSFLLLLLLLPPFPSPLLPGSPSSSLLSPSLRSPEEPLQPEKYPRYEPVNPGLAETAVRVDRVVELVLLPGCGVGVEDLGGGDGRDEKATRIKGGGEGRERGGEGG